MPPTALSTRPTQRIDARARLPDRCSSSLHGSERFGVKPSQAWVADLLLTVRARQAQEPQRCDLQRGSSTRDSHVLTAARVVCATVEHAGVKDLIKQLEGVEPDGEMYDAKVKVLSEYVKHHVKEEQNEMFPKAKSSSLDLVELGSRMAARKDELMAQVA
jgi:hypothetical protein